MFVIYFLTFKHNKKCLILFYTVSADLDADIEVHFSLSAVPAADLFQNLRQILKALPLPYNITPSVKVVDVAFTTGQSPCLLIYFALLSNYMTIK